MNKKILTEIKTRFEAALQAKTGWGRNDVMALYNQIVTEVLMEHIDGQ